MTDKERMNQSFWPFSEKAVEKAVSYVENNPVEMLLYYRHDDVSSSRYPDVATAQKALQKSILEDSYILQGGIRVGNRVAVEIYSRDDVLDWEWDE